MATKAEFVDLVLSQVGTWCYVWGGNGQDMTAMTAIERETWIKKREGIEDNRTRVRLLFEKLTAEGVAPIRGGDCSGFVYWCLKELGLHKTDTTANGFYGESQKISREELEAGDLAYRLDAKGKATHIGVYVGDGYFVHSKGRDVGVVKEKSSKTYWNGFGRLNIFSAEPTDIPTDKPTTDEEAVHESEETAESVDYVLFKGSVNLRKAPSIFGKTVRIARKGDRLPLLSRGYFDARGCEWYAVDASSVTPKTPLLYCSAFTGKRTVYTEVVAK